MHQAKVRHNGRISAADAKELLEDEDFQSLKTAEKGRYSLIAKALKRRQILCWQERVLGVLHPNNRAHNAYLDLSANAKGHYIRYARGGRKRPIDWFIKEYNSRHGLPGCKTR